ncbi:beta-ketoacyl synthase N-terminal-like domain-containing protein [Mycobacterium leprae]|uniref:beta-ketoacyl synthase N-terminal-like domain-containing protein n=1 Tax=Mycobacterium leprae TaxID=1769 RepID=UPI0013A674E7
MDSPDGLWEVVAASRDVMSDFPDDRSWAFGVTNRRKSRRYRQSYTRCGQFLANVADFDNTFFGIAPSETLDLQ